MIDGLRPYPSTKATGSPWLGKIPEHWEVRRNGRLFGPRREIGFPGLPVLEVSIRSGVRVRDFDGGRKQEMADRSKYQRAVRGDIAYNMMRMWQGAVGVAPTDGLVSPAYVVARPFADTNAAYYAYLFRTAAYMRETDMFSRGIVPDRNRLYWEAFKQMPSAYPPPIEQRLIVRFLDWHGVQTAKLICAKRRLIALLNEQKQVAIHHAVTRGLNPDAMLRPSGVSWIGYVPTNWEVWKIGRLGRVGNGSTPSRSNRAYWAAGTYPWLNSSVVNSSPINASTQFVTELALTECHLPKVRAGSIIIAITGQGRTRGKAALMAFEATINQHLAYVELTKPELSSEYLQLVLTAAYAQLREISDDNGSTKGALTCQDIRDFKVPVPPMKQQLVLQQEVWRRIAGVDRAAKAAEQELRLVEEFRIRLVADVVTGKLDVRVVAASLPEASEHEAAATLVDDEDAGESSEDLEDEELAA